MTALAEEMYVGKGEFMPARKKLSLASGKHLRELVIHLSWEFRHDAGPPFDLNTVVFPLNDQGVVPTGRHCVYYNNLMTPDHSIQHEGDDPDGRHGGEVVRVHLRMVPPSIQRIAFAVVIYDGVRRHEDFGIVANARIRFSAEDHGELDRHELAANFAKYTGVVVGEMVRVEDDWEFHVQDEGFYNGLGEIGHKYGVNFRDVEPE